jgi:hypothetical protein
VRATLVVLLVLCCATGHARAQSPLEVGAPDIAFAGGPLHLSKNAIAALHAHYQGDKVPLVPQPFRGKLDTALAGRDWPRLEAEKKALVAARGMVAALLWEQSRFIATGSLGVAEMHALDIAATGSSGLSETAVMLWFYAVAVTMTDGHKCVEEAARDAHLDRLRGPAFEPVLQIVRTISDDRLTAMRDLAVRLETVLAVDRNDDTMCQSGGGKADVKPDAQWRPEAVSTRGMLPRHLLALTSVMRPRPIARPEPPKPEPFRSVAAKPATPDTPVTIAPIFPGAGLNVPMLPELEFPTPITTMPRAGPRVNIAPAQPDAASVEPPVRPDPAPVNPSAPGPANPDAAMANSTAAPVKAEPAAPQPPNAGLVTGATGQPNPTRFEPPELELTAPGQPANH